LGKSKIHWLIAAPVALAIVITYLGVTGWTFTYFVWGILFGLVIADFFFHLLPFRKDNFIGYFAFIFLVVLLSVVGNPLFNVMTWAFYWLVWNYIPRTWLIPWGTMVGPYSYRYPLLYWVVYYFAVSFCLCLSAWWDAGIQSSGKPKSTAA
jgi:hypothetical protein